MAQSGCEGSSNQLSNAGKPAWGAYLTYEMGADSPCRIGLIVRKVERPIGSGPGRCASFNTRRGRRLRVLVHCQNKNAALSPVACGDPNCRAHKGSARLGAKEWLHNG